MNRRTDQDYLLNHQYKTSSNLKARSTLHERFNTNPQGWTDWVFDQFDFPDDARILELGCGPAWLWKGNLDRIPEGWEITLSDFSSGMLAEARENLRDRPFQFEQVDAQEIPLDDEAFDGVIANHMLYHVPDRPKALAEIRRVLKPAGRFFAATNGATGMRELFELVKRVNPDAYDGSSSVNAFGLENGADQLAPWFEGVEVRRHENALAVTEADPLIAYVASSDRLNEDQLIALRNILEAELQEKGVIHIRKDQGLFAARKATR